MRRTTVLVKKPTSPAVASSSRPATGVPRGMSVPQPCRVSRAASPACTVMNTVAPCARASRRSASCAVASRAKGTVSPAEVATGGRGRSVGSSNWSGSPASACRQWASWASASAVGSAGEPRSDWSRAAWSTYWPASGANSGARPCARAV